MNAKKKCCCSAQMSAERATLGRQAWSARSRWEIWRADHFCRSQGGNVERCDKIQTLPQGSFSFESTTKIFCCHSQGMVAPEGLRNKAEEDNSSTPINRLVLLVHQTIPAGCSHFEAVKVPSPGSCLFWEACCHASLLTVPLLRALQGYIVLVLFRYLASASHAGLMMLNGVMENRRAYEVVLSCVIISWVSVLKPPAD